MWRAVVGGRTLTFRLVGINNQNFVMEDEQTGTWWQQVNGLALFGPLAGERLELVPHDEVSFAIWKAEHPEGRVLGPDPDVVARDRYATATWEQEIAQMPTVTPLPADSPLAARTLVVGVDVNGRSKAYPLAAVRDARALMDDLNGVPIVIVVAPDGRSVRAFDRRVDGRALDFVVKNSEGPLELVDLGSGSVWDFAGEATSGLHAGQRLARVRFLLDYWFDWQTYHPDTEVYRTWQPRRAS